MGLVAKIKLEGVIRKIESKDVALQNWFLNFQIVCYLLLFIAAMIGSAIWLATNQVYNQNEKAVWIVRLAESLIWAVINLSMMVMMYKHS